MLQVSVCFTVFRFTAYGSSLGDYPEIAAQTVKLQHLGRGVFPPRTPSLVTISIKDCYDIVAVVRELALPGIPREIRPTELQKNCNTGGAEALAPWGWAT